MTQRGSTHGQALGLALLLCLAFLLGGCGYSFTGSAPGLEDASKLDPAYRQMAIARVENPTVESWLEPRLRGLIRDEFTRRRLVTWVGRPKATALLTIDIKNYTRATKVTGQQDQSVKLSTGMKILFRIHRAADNLLLWDSGEQSFSESYYPGDEDGADQRLTDLAIRRMADLMTEGY